MRFGHRPRVADTFCGSGQIPFEAARLGCDVFASDLNPIACMLTWGAFHIVGGSVNARKELSAAQQTLVDCVQQDVDALAIETDGNGWRIKALLYCVEVKCPETGWSVPLLSTLVLSKSRSVIAELVPNRATRSYAIRVRVGVSAQELADAAKGTVRSDGRGQDPYLLHLLDGVEHRTRISSLRGDFRTPDGTQGSAVRRWEKDDFKPRPGDVFQDRLYAIQWSRPKPTGRGDESEFRAVTEDDLRREAVAEKFVADHLADWQARGWIPDMRIEPGDKTDEPIRTRGWTYWHHLFCPRQLLFLGLANKYIQETKSASLALVFSRLTDWSSKLCRYGTGAARESIAATFYNQALGTWRPRLRARCAKAVTSRGRCSWCSGSGAVASEPPATTSRGN